MNTKDEILERASKHPKEIPFLLLTAFLDIRDNLDSIRLSLLVMSAEK